MLYRTVNVGPQLSFCDTSWLCQVINTLFCLRHFDIPAESIGPYEHCVSRSFMQGKEKKTSPGNGVPSRVRRSLPCSTWPRSLQSIQLKLSLLTGSPSSESPACVALNMLRKRSQLSTSTNTLQVNVSLKPSSLLI